MNRAMVRQARFGTLSFGGALSIAQTFMGPARVPLLVLGLVLSAMGAGLCIWSIGLWIVAGSSEVQR